MERFEIIQTIGRELLKSNTENMEFNYQVPLQDKGINYKRLTEPYERNLYHKTLDIRFSNDRLSVLIETKNNRDDWNKDKIYKQIEDYVKYEKALTNNKIIAIIANTDDDRTLMWEEDEEGISINDDYVIKNNPILTFEEYEDRLFGTVNNKLKVIQNTYKLNETLQAMDINTKIRSQFVGTCLLALKNGLSYVNSSTAQIRAGIEEILTQLLEGDLNRAIKIVILKAKVIDSQDVKTLTKENFQKILSEIRNDILPYINDKNTMGQDLLNLFFTTFNKYSGKSDKNQAFTPDHITDFMCKVCGVNRNSHVLDPCCGSGSFLVRALTEAMNDCDSKAQKKKVRLNNIYGIENEESAFGLSTTNMLIHGDGNSNIIQGSCFEESEFIKNAHIDIVLMNPPYNAAKKSSWQEYARRWPSKTTKDPSKGFHYVEFIANKVNKGKMAVLLPVACAIGSEKEKEIRKFKELMMENHTLDAVFSFPEDVFYPGANVCACCMVFNLGTRHRNATQDTFFGYYKNDGFTKKKKLGRIEKTDENGNGVWKTIEEEWLRLYRTRTSKPGLSVVKKVGPQDEWLAEAYMETDYSTLTDDDFSQTVRDYVGYLAKSGKING